MSKYDFVIIGSGLGGLICGYILSKEGYNVCILEKNSKFGGNMQSFERDGCSFDTGMHYIGSLEKGQILHRIFEYLGLNNKIKVKKLDEDGFDTIIYNEKEYKLAMGYDRFVEKLSKDFPGQTQGLIKYTDKLKEVSRALHMYNLREGKSDNWIEIDYVRQNAHDFLSSVITDDALLNIITGNNSLYAGNVKSTPLYMMALISNFFIESAWRLVDGSDQISDFLVSAIRSNGGTAVANAEVKSFSFDGDNITSVECVGNQSFVASTFISNVHPVTTLRLVPPDKIKKSYRNRLESIDNTLSVFSLYVILKENSFPYLNSNYYYCSEKNTWIPSYYHEDGWPYGYMMITPATSHTGKYAGSVIFTNYMSYNEVKKWEHTFVENRGAEYQEFKTRKAEQLLDMIELHFSGFRRHIKSYYTSTPLTYRDFTGTKDGSMYGFIRDCNDPIKSYVPPKTKIPNLFFTGQNVNLHGILGVSFGAVLTCSEFLGMDNIIKKINAAYR